MNTVLCMIQHISSYTPILSQVNKGISRLLDCGYRGQVLYTSLWLAFSKIFTVPWHFQFLHTIEFRISVGTTLIYFEYFSHSYALIWEPTLISFELFRYMFEQLTCNKPYRNYKTNIVWMFRCFLFILLDNSCLLILISILFYSL